MHDDDTKHRAHRSARASTSNRGQRPQWSIAADTGWSASRIARLIESQRCRCGAESLAHASPLRPIPERAGDLQREPNLLHQITLLDHHEFVDTAYRTVLGRPPTSNEYVDMLTALVNGDSKTWLLAVLRYSDEGRTFGLSIPGLRYRHLAQRLFRLPAIGPLFEWLHAIVRLPHALRRFSAISQAGAGNVLDVARTIRLLAANELAAVDARRDVMEADFDDPPRGEPSQRATHDDLRHLKDEFAVLKAHADALRVRLDALHPPPLKPTLELKGDSLLAKARERSAIPANVPTSELGAHARYALFETVFYDSDVVAAKQRVYLPYVHRSLAAQYPFLDLGCGRGEFMRILASEGISVVGVDKNGTGLDSLRCAGFEVVEGDLLDFLGSDERTFAGASLLQVAEHLSAGEIERMLALLAKRLPPGAPLIVETPNPLSPFALGYFHTDPTHVAPIPPERMQFTIEAAGFERARILFQARVPESSFLGPDPRAYYMDYAVVAYRSSL